MEKVCEVGSKSLQKIWKKSWKNFLGTKYFSLFPDVEKV